MSDCPLVRLAYSLKILKQFERTGRVAIPLTDWIRFFEALAFMRQEGQREIYCVIAGDHMVLSKTPLKRKTAPTQQDLFDR
jgi:hypothetical protein